MVLPMLETENYSVKEIQLFRQTSITLRREKIKAYLSLLLTMLMDTAKQKEKTDISSTESICQQAILRGAFGTLDNTITRQIHFSFMCSYNSCVQRICWSLTMHVYRFIANVSQIIRVKSSTETEAHSARSENESFQKVFPYFTWLLRDFMNRFPEDCRDAREFFIKKVRI